jgi:short-subunit dehydrogenase
MIVPFDVADIKAMQKAYKTITKVVGVPSCIVHAAGVYSPMHARDLQLDKALQTLDVNLASALKLLSLVLPDLRARRSGHLVFVSSVAGYVGLPNSMAYGASKAGLSNLAESLRIELAPENIKVQLVSPGFVKTRLTKQNDFTMPFLMEVEDAAARIVKGMKSSAFEIHFPRRFSYFMKLLRILPRPIFFWVMKWF